MPYSWDANVARFRDPKGRFISESTIRQLLDIAIDVKEVERLTRDYKMDLLTREGWREGMRALIKKSYIQASLLARGGRGQMTQADWGAVGGNIAEQYHYLDQKANSFLDTIDDLTIKQAVARARMYVQSARQQFEEFMRQNKLGIGAVYEKWVLGPTEHCQDCKDLASLGRVPIGTLWTVPGAGDTQCLTNCHCRIAYYNHAGKTLSEQEVISILSAKKLAFSIYPSTLGNVVLLDEPHPDSHAWAKLGGPGSGNWGHAGRPGKRGGSLPKSGSIPTGVNHTPKEMSDLFNRELDNLGAPYKWDTGSSVNPGMLKDDVITTLSEKTGLHYDDVDNAIREWANTSNDHSLSAMSMQEAIAEEFGVPMSEWQRERYDHLKMVDEALAFRQFQQEALINAPSNLSLHDLQVIKEGQREEFFKRYPDIERATEEIPYHRAFKYDDFETWHPLPKPSLNRDQERALVRAMYNNTQAMFQRNEIYSFDNVTLYRGFTSGQHLKPGPYSLKSNAASAWSLDIEIARDFSQLEMGTSHSIVKAQVPVSSILSTPFTGFGCLREGEFVVMSNSGSGRIMSDSEFDNEPSYWAYSEYQGYLLGGAGSGNWGHAGRPGKRGGSLPRSAGMSLVTGPDWEQRWHTARGEDFGYGRYPGPTDSTKSGYTHIEQGLPSVLSSITLRGEVKGEIVAELTAETGLPYEEVDYLVRQWAKSANDEHYGSLSVQEAISEEFGVPLSPWQRERIQDYGRHWKDPEFRDLWHQRVEGSKAYIRAVEKYGFHSNEAGEARYSQNKINEQMLVKVGGFFRADIDRYGPSLADFTKDPQAHARKIVRAMYENTQEKLASEGITELTLYRGAATHIRAKTGQELSGVEIPKYAEVVVQNNAASSWTADPNVAHEFGSVVSMTVPASRVLSTARTGFGCLNEYEYVLLGSNNDRASLDWAEVYGEDSSDNVLLGGPGSGHHGHAGRPGKRGGSAPSGLGSHSAMSTGWVWEDRIKGIPKVLEFDQRAAEIYIIPFLEHEAANSPLSWSQMAGPYQTDQAEQVAQKLAEKYDLDKDQVLETMQAWTAGPWNPNSIEIQKAVSEEFGVPMTEYNKKAYAEIPREVMTKRSDIEGKMITIHPIEQDDAKKIVRAMYKETQEYLQPFKTPHPDGDRIKLYRGVTFSKETRDLASGELIQTKTSPLSSWAVTSLVARQFAEAAWPDGAVIATDVPFSRILSLPFTGIGSLSEGEIMVIGGTNDTAEVITRMGGE